MLSLASTALNLTTTTISFTTRRPFLALCTFRFAVDLSSVYFPEHTVTITQGVEKYANTAFQLLSSRINIGKHLDRYSFWNHHTFVKATSFLDQKIPEGFASFLLAITLYFGKYDVGQKNITNIEQLNYGTFLGVLSYLHIALVYLSRQVHYGLNSYYVNEGVVESTATSVRSEAAKANISDQDQVLDSIMVKGKEVLSKDQATKTDKPLTYRHVIGSTGKWMLLTGISWYPPLYFISSVTSVIPDPYSLTTALAVSWYMNRLLASKSEELIKQPSPQTENSERLNTEICDIVKNLDASEKQKENFGQGIRTLDLHGKRIFSPVEGNALKVEGNVVVTTWQIFQNWAFSGRKTVTDQKPAAAPNSIVQNASAQPAINQHAQQPPATVPDPQAERIRAMKPVVSGSQEAEHLDPELRETLEKNLWIDIPVPDEVGNPTADLNVDHLNAATLLKVIRFLLKKRGTLNTDQEADIAYCFREARIRRLTSIYIQIKESPNYCNGEQSAAVAFKKEIEASVSYFKLRRANALIPGYLDDMQRILDEKPKDKWTDKTVPQEAINKLKGENPASNNNAADEHAPDENGLYD